MMKSHQGWLDFPYCLQNAVILFMLWKRTEIVRYVFPQHQQKCMLCENYKVYICAGDPFLVCVLQSGHWGHLLVIMPYYIQLNGNHVQWASLQLPPLFSYELYSMCNMCKFMYSLCICNHLISSPKVAIANGHFAT